MNTLTTVLLVVLVIAAVALGVLWYFGRKIQTNQIESQKLIEQMAQNVTILVIDKKKMRVKDAPLPKQVYEQSPFYMKWAKVGVVKAKIGPKVYNLITDGSVFNQLPVKNECKVKLSGLYITEVLKGGVLDEKTLKKRQKAKAKAAKKAEKEAKKAEKD